MLPGLQFVLLPASAWTAPSDSATPEAREFHQCVRDATAIEARLTGSPDREADLRRYSAVCHRIEELSAEIDDATTVRVGTDYLQAVSRLSGTRHAYPRLAATFFQPQEIAQLRSAVEHERPDGAEESLAALARAYERGEGLVIVVDPYNAPPSPAEARTPQVVDDAAGLLHSTVAEAEGPTSFEESRNLLDALRRYIVVALAGRAGVRVPFGAFPDAAVTRALHEAVYSTGEVAMVVPVYTDGSRSAPFPVRCRRPASNAPSQPATLRAALVSMRHLELDPLIDCAWFRNRDVSVSRSAGETEALCAQLTAGRLRELRAALPQDATLTIDIYQTGLPQAVIGFYRGVLMALLDGVWASGSLAVVPMFFEPWTAARYAPGPVWT